MKRVVNIIDMKINKDRKTFLGLAASLFFLIFCSMPAFADAGMSWKTENIRKQDVVYFGASHPGDGFYGRTAETPIGWMVLDPAASSMGGDGIFLLSKELFGKDELGIDFSEDGTSDDWNSSDVKKLCDLLFEKAFSNGEKNTVLTTTKNDAAGTIEYSIPGHQRYTNFKAFTLSNAKLFSLSWEEVKKYQDMLQITAAYNAFTSNNFWWLRSPAENSVLHFLTSGANCYAGIIDTGGKILSFYVGFNKKLLELHGSNDVEAYKNDSTTNRACARPAFNLNRSQVVFSFAATGKGTGLTGGLQANKESDSGEWKLSLLDQNLGVTVDQNNVTRNGNQVTIPYTAKGGSNCYVSAAIYNTKNKVVTYYGRLQDASSGSSGKLEFTLPEMTVSDVLYVFCEQVNGDRRTDYSGEPVEVKNIKGSKADPNPDKPVNPDDNSETQPVGPSSEPSQVIVYVPVPVETPATETACTEEQPPTVFDAESKVLETVEARAKGTLAVTKVHSKESSILLTGATTFQYAKRSETKPDSVITAKAFSETVAEKITIDLRGSSTRLTFGKNAFSSSQAVKLILKGNVASRFNFKEGAFQNCAIEEITIKGMKSAQYKKLAARIKKAGYSGNIVKK